MLMQIEQFWTLLKSCGTADVTLENIREVPQHPQTPSSPHTHISQWERLGREKMPS